MFELSTESVKRINELGIDCNEYLEFVTKWGTKQIPRNNPILIQVIEEFGKHASHNRNGDIRIIDIPDDVRDWYIVDYDGQEHVAEGRTWCYEGKES